MPFNAEETLNATNSALHFNITGPALRQHIRDRPLLSALMGSRRTIPGGRGLVTRNVKFETVTTLSGYSHDDTVTFANPAKIKKAEYPWKEGHSGISFTLTEMTVGGIQFDPKGPKGNYSADEKVALTDLLQDKIEDLTTGYLDGLWTALWDNGLADPKLPPGIMSMIIPNPTIGVVGGLDRATYPKWRNYTDMGIVATAATAPDMPVSTALKKMRREIGVYGGKTTHIFAGKDFLDAVERERLAKGMLTQTGWSGRQDVGMGDTAFDGKDIVHDSMLDQMGQSKFCYMLNIGRDGIEMRPVNGRDGTTFNPVPPPEKYVFYQAYNVAYALACWRMNSQGLLSIA